MTMICGKGRREERNGAGSTFNARRSPCQIKGI